MRVDIAKHDCTIQWDGVYYFALSDYPCISPWELRKLLSFIDYEKRHGRQTELVCEDKAILEAVNNAIVHPETVTDALLPEKITECTYCKQEGCLTQFVCHTATLENAKKIFKDGKLLSAVRAFNMTANKLVQDKRNAAGDPADYFDYLMFSWGNCQAGDRLVMERTLGRSPTEDEYQNHLIPGIRFYFRYADIIRHPGFVLDGYHPVKIRNELILSDWLYACIIPKHYQNELEREIQPDILNKTFYLPQDGLALLDWTKKVFDFVEGLE